MRRPANIGSRLSRPRKTILIVLLVSAAALNPGCVGASENPRLAGIPDRMMWAWERPEDLRFIDPEKIGIAYLAQTITLQNDDVLVRSRRQELQAPNGSYIMAVTRIETSKERGKKPDLTSEQLRRTADLVARTIELPRVKAVQVDFDAVVSERNFYRRLLEILRERLGDKTPLSMTALASWCVGDRWFRDLPVDEVVPMAFEMGTDEQRIREFISNGNDWNEKICRTSFGLLAGDPLKNSIDGSRRIYFFKTEPWEKADLEPISE
jgi:hypothetical protein